MAHGFNNNKTKAEIQAIKANPTASASETLSKLQVGDSVYKVGNVQANPSGTASETLETIAIDGTNYNVGGSGGGGLIFIQYTGQGETVTVPANSYLKYDVEVPLPEPLDNNYSYHSFYMQAIHSNDSSLSTAQKSKVIVMPTNAWVDSSTNKAYISFVVHNMNDVQLNVGVSTMVGWFKSPKTN